MKCCRVSAGVARFSQELRITLSKLAAFVKGILNMSARPASAECTKRTSAAVQHHICAGGARLIRLSVGGTYCGLLWLIATLVAPERDPQV